MKTDDQQDHPTGDLLRVAAQVGAHLRARAAAPARPAGDDCLSDDDIAAFAEGTLTANERAEALPHVATCARCRSAIASLVRTLGDPDVAREVEVVRPAETVEPVAMPYTPSMRPAHPARRRAFRVLAPAAIAAALILFVWRRPASDVPPTHRSGPMTALTPVPAAPIGSVARPTALRWRPVAGADRYRVSVFNAEGRVVYEQLLSDTIVPLPDSLTLVAGQTYIWKVEARSGWDRWESSPLVEFIIGRSP